MTEGNSLALQGRVALITGGSRGIGRAIAKAMAEAGADVMVNYVSDEESAKKTAEEIMALGRKAMTFQADVADADAVNAMAGAAVEGLGKVEHPSLQCRNHPAGQPRLRSRPRGVPRGYRKPHYGRVLTASRPCCRTCGSNLGGHPAYFFDKRADAAAGPDLLQRCQGGCGGDGPGAFQGGAGPRHSGNVIGPTTTETDMASGLLQRYGFSSFREVDLTCPSVG